MSNIIKEIQKYRQAIKDDKEFSKVKEIRSRIRSLEDELKKLLSEQSAGNGNS